MVFCPCPSTPTSHAAVGRADDDRAGNRLGTNADFSRISSKTGKNESIFKYSLCLVPTKHKIKITLGKSFGNPFRHLADGTVRLFLAEALILPTGFVTTVFLTRTLGPEGYGLFTLSITLFLWASVFANSLFTRSTIKFVSETNDWGQVATTSLRLHLITGVCTAILFWSLSKLIASFLDEPKLETYLKLFAFEVLVLSLVQAHRSIIIGIGHFRERAVVSAIRWPARLFLIVLFVEMGLSVSGAILGSIGATMVEHFV